MHSHVSALNPTGALEAAVAALARGELVLITDSADADAAGMLALSAQHADAASLHRLARLGGGTSYLALTAERCDQLGLEWVDAQRDDLGQPPVTLPISAADGMAHGLGAAERAHTIRVASDPARGRSAVRQGGNVLPLRARRGGVLERAGYTEAAVDLAALAGLLPAAVLGEVLGADGAELRGDALYAFALAETIPVVTVGELIAALRDAQSIVQRVVMTPIATRAGEYTAFGYVAPADGTEHMALVRGAVAGTEDVPVYIHRSCWEGDVFRSLRCDCRARLDAVQATIAREGRGVIVHLAYDGYLTHQPREHDEQIRDFGIGAQILADLGLSTIHVFTDRARPLPGLEGYNLRVTGYRPLLAASS